MEGVKLMGLCRFACLTSPLRLSQTHPHAPPHAPSLLFAHSIPIHFPSSPRNSSKLSVLPSPVPPKSVLSSQPTLPFSMESPPPGYRRNVGICLINDDKKIFSASRLDVPASWQMPQGGIDDAEDPRNAAIRELREETGVTSAEILAEVPYWLTYDFPPQVREKLRHQWGQDWIGQAQKWFLFKFTGKDEEINLLGDGSEKPEFGNWSWLSPEQLIDLSVDFKKPVYKEAFAAFAPHLQKHSPM